MTLSRRETLTIGLGAFAATFVLPKFAFAATEDAIAEFTGGAATGQGDLTLTAPEIAENGNTVPIEIDAPGAEAVLILAAGNPNPDVATFHFGPLAGSHVASTRIRLAGTQDVVAVAKMSDGSFVEARQEVKVTIGGCGG
ncbi:sulfur oxidation protein SoxY [Roseivivax jejudonensis]|uniref:Sulfur oxidation protein SoxY n=1 Tax=Roseivivax jejudonensis TaxID=1529041 RepID=A0A1X6YVI5_9RHOB|nr:thiosulfate oxidation carrier protein SoxY [Roseivivax jejudonensis]SLN32681.1 sulfur oxidation protein SoxY [Roseivivax jejudonensis]